MSINQRIKEIREKSGLSQQVFATSIGLKRGNYAMLEIGKQMPTINTISEIVRIYDTSYEWLVDGKKPQVKLAIKSKLTDLEGTSLRVLPIVTDKKNKENIVFVPVKAIAGYLNGYQDPEFIKELPSFSLVGFTNGTYRAFEVSGDSMHPVIRDKSIVVGHFIENFFDTKEDRIYVIKTKTELVVKYIINELKRSGDLILVSKNNFFKPYTIPANEIDEIWEIKVIISTPFNNNDNEISSRIDELEKQLISLRKKLK